MVRQNHKLNKLPMVETYPFDITDIVAALHTVLSHPKIRPGMTITIADLDKYHVPKDAEGAVDLTEMVGSLFQVQQFKKERTIRIVAKPKAKEIIVVPSKRII